MAAERDPQGPRITAPSTDQSPWRFLRLLHLPLVLGLAAIALANLAQAAIFPLELELRESCEWLYVLAQRAGIDIYDHSRVAFINMSHGPLDTWFKQSVAALFPALPAPLVLRCFVLLLPAALVVAFRIAGRRPWREAVAWGVGLEIALLGIYPPVLLVGRSDSSALVLLSGLLVALTAAIRPQARVFPWAVAAGVCGAATLFTNWRTAPFVFGSAAVWALEGALSTAHSGRVRRFLGACVSGFLLGAAAVFVGILAGILHGSATLFYRHFFGFFTAAGGYGTQAGAHFAMFPPELVAGMPLLHLALLGALVLSVLHRPADLPRVVQLGGWLPLLVASWVVCAIGLHLNRTYGGPWYFAGFYLLLGCYLARCFDAIRSARPRLTGILGLVLLVAVPWPSVGREAVILNESFGPAAAFARAVHEANARERVWSENYFLLQDTYGGEVVEVGDMTAAVTATRFFGEDHAATAERYFSRLEAAPPRFFLTGPAVRPAVAALLRRAYRPVLRLPPLQGRYAGAEQVLYERLDAAAAPH